MPHKFKDRDIQRVIKAARSAGIDVGRVSVNPHTGYISVIVRQPGDAVTHAEGGASADDTAEAIINKL